MIASLEFSFIIADMIQILCISLVAIISNGEANWKQNSDSLKCNLCEATADIPRPICNPQLLKPNTWFTKEITVTETNEENETYTYAKQITICMPCMPCMMTPWDIQTPTDWKKSAARMETLATGTDRVWRRKTKKT
eukprot:scaffold117470_cov40-Attheya_sp.AAC.2